MINLSNIYSCIDSKKQLRKHKEQILTDIMCSIPDRLSINEKLQTLDPTCTRVKTWLNEEVKDNWLKDPYTLLILLTLITSFIFYIVALCY